MSKKVAILQSSYIPWKGFFDIIGLVDEFIFYDDVQFSRGSWRNRNRIKTSRGPAWVTIPVVRQFPQMMKDTLVDGTKWRDQHWKTIQANYGRAPFFREYESIFRTIYFNDTQRLSQINFQFTEAICKILDIQTKLSWSMDYRLEGDPTERLLSLCQQAGASEYLSGPAAQAYLDEQAFEPMGIKLTYMDYEGYPEYPQLYPPFEHNVSIIDMIFSVGPDSRKYMKS